MSDPRPLTEEAAKAALSILFKVVKQAAGPKVAAVFRDRPDKRQLILSSLARHLQISFGPRRASELLELGNAVDGIAVGTPSAGEPDETVEIEAAVRAKADAHSWTAIYGLAARAIVGWHLQLRMHPLSATSGNTHPWEPEIEKLLGQTQAQGPPSRKIKTKLRKLARVCLAGSVGASLARCVRPGWFGMYGVWLPLRLVPFVFEDDDVANAYVLVSAAAADKPDDVIDQFKRETASIVWEYRDELWDLAGKLRRSTTLKAREVTRTIQPPEDEIDDFSLADDIDPSARRKQEREFFSRRRDQLEPHRVKSSGHPRRVYSERMFTFTRFKRALDYVVQHAPPGSRLVHGEVWIVSHAWVEMPDGVVYDPVLQDLYPQDAYYREMEAEVSAEYPWRRAVDRLLETGHFGPWGERLFSRRENKSKATESELRKYQKLLGPAD